MVQADDERTERGAAEEHDDVDEVERARVHAKRRRSKRRGWGWVAALAVLAALAIVAIEAVARFPDWVRQRVLQEAAARGLSLEAAHIEPVGLLPWESGPRMVVLREVAVRLDGVDDVDVRVQRVEIDVVGFEPVRSRAVGVALRAPRPAALFELEQRAASTRWGLPIAVRELRIRVTQLVDALPAGALLELREATITEGTVDLHGGEIRVELPVVPGVRLGPYHVTLDREGEKLGVTVKELPGVQIETDTGLSRATLLLARTDQRALMRLVPGLSLPVLDVEAKVQLSLAGREALSGTVEATVRGWAPPRPKELGGIVYGDTTRLRASFAREGLLSMRLDDVELRAGSLRLKGHGRLDGAGGGALELELAGSIDCRELAASAIGAHLGLPAGAFAAQLTRGHLEGSVAVSLSVKAPLRRPTEAQIAPNAVLRCKLKLL